MTNTKNPSAYQVGGTHYTDKALQPWDAMQAWMSQEAFEGFLAGNVIKYLARYKAKNGLQDVLKAQHYLDKLASVIEAYEADKAAAGVANGSDGWIKWDGGKECPVHPDTVVEVALRLDAKKLTSHAWKLNWEHHWWEDDVMAYRVVQEASEAAPAAAKAEPAKPNHTGRKRCGDCWDCRHCHVSYGEDPCKSCLASEEGFPNWEPAEDNE